MTGVLERGGVDRSKVDGVVMFEDFEIEFEFESEFEFEFE